MCNKLFLALGATALLVTSLAQAAPGDRLRERIRARMVEKMRTAGTRVERQEFPGDGLQGHAEINRRLGDPDYAATGVVDRWLKDLFEG